MSHTHLKESLQDVAFTLPTPLTEGGVRVDRDGLARNIEYLIESGASVLVPCGNTGEYYSLSNEERATVVETTVEVAGDDATVVAGAGGSTKQVLSLADRYAGFGADSLMVMNPSHAHLHEEGLKEYYRTIADRSEIPLVIYKRSRLVGNEVLSDLVNHENIVAVKFAVNDINAFSMIANRHEADVVWINGIAERFEPSYALEGADGFTTGIGNFVPNVVMELQRALADKNWSKAMQIRNDLQPLEQIRAEAGVNNDIPDANNVPVIKHGMELAGLSGGPVREPLVELDEGTEQRVTELFHTLSSEATAQQ